MARAKEKTGAEVVPLYRPRKCAVCGQPTVRQYHPFCSKKCADIDLGRWLTGKYAIPAEPVPDAESEDKDGDE